MAIDTSEVVDALQDIEQAVGRVETAVRQMPEHLDYAIRFAIVGLVIFYLIPVVFGQVWHSKWRYALSYDIPHDKVFVSPEPHDCNFLSAPLGEKYCHYDRKVSTVRWAMSTTRNPIYSEDDGKTWTEFEPTAGVRVPQYSTVEEVYIEWEKKDD